MLFLLCFSKLARILLLESRLSRNSGAAAFRHCKPYKESTMKKTTTAALVAALLLWAGFVNADWSANLGWASEYHYRGIFQASSSASGGLDFERGAFTQAPGLLMSAMASRSTVILATAVKLVISATVLALPAITTPAILTTPTRKSISAAAMDWSRWMLRSANMRISQARRRTIPTSP